MHQNSQINVGTSFLKSTLVDTYLCSVIDTHSSFVGVSPSVPSVGAQSAVVLPHLSRGSVDFHVG